MDTSQNPTDLKTDLAKLEKIDWVAATILRFRLGSHPDFEIENLLKRRLNLPAKKYLGSLPVRLLCTFAMILTFFAVAWGFFWFAFSIAGFTNFLRELSVLMTFLMVIIFGIGFSHPLKLFDEKAVEKAGSEVIRSLRVECAEEKSSSEARQG